MDDTNEQATIPPINNQDIIRAMQDTRRPYQRQLAVYLILASLLLEAVAFLFVDLTKFNVLTVNETFHWTVEHSNTPSAIFEGT